MNKASKNPEEVRLTIRIPTEYYEGLKSSAERKHISLSDVIRFALAGYIERDGRKDGHVNH